MKKQLNILDKDSIWNSFKSILIILIAFSVTCLIIGGLCDLKISELMAGTNQEYFASKQNLKSFWAYFSGIQGPISTIIFTIVLSIIFLSIIKHDKIHVIFKILGSLLIYVCLWYKVYDAFTMQIHEQFGAKIDTVGILLITFCCSLLFFGISSITINHFILKNDNKMNQQYLLAWSIWAIIIFSIGMLFVMTTKFTFRRERYYQLMTTGHIENFKNWYSLLWDSNTTDGIFHKSQMSSFISGHTSWSMLVFILLPLIYSSKMNRWIKVSLEYSCCLFVVLTMFARIGQGSHYLSDTAMAIFIYSCLYLTFTYGWYYLSNTYINLPFEIVHKTVILPKQNTTIKVEQSTNV